MKNLFSILICSVVATTLFAQSPNKISYQTLIRNSSNQLVQNQNISIRITIVEDSVTGAGAYEESHNVKTNSNGLASIEIGGGTVTYGDFKFINWSKGVFFIKSEIDPTGGTNYTISGIQQLLSVPYAIYAREAREVHLPLAKESNSKISMSIATSYSEGDGAIGIIGAATNPLNFNIGVQGIANGRSTFSAGVDGRNCYVGVRGIADIADIVPEQPSYGVIGQSISSKERSAGVFGRGLMGLLAESRDTSQNRVSIEASNGYLKVSGEIPAAFVHTVSATNQKNGTYTTELTYPGMQESDLIFITRSKTSANASSYSVSYINGKWNIINEDQNKALSLGDQFNVLIIKR